MDLNGNKREQYKELVEELGYVKGLILLNKEGNNHAKPNKLDWGATNSN